MGKLCLWFGGAATTLLGLYFAALAIPKLPPWSPYALFVGFVVAAVLFLLTGLVYLFLLYKKYRNPLEILDDWRCTYWPSERQLQVLLWFRDYSGVSEFLTKCVAQFGQQVVNVNDNVTIGGSYVSKGGLKSGQDQPIMVEFLKHNVELSDTNTATILTTIRPSRGVWTTKQRTKVVSVQVINR